VALQIANSIWCRQSFEVEQEFIDLNTTYFNAEVASLDFTTPDAPVVINGWIENNTNGNIKKVIESIDPLTMMFLINAIYFKGSWTYEFEKKHTRDRKFNLSDGSEKMCKMMRQENDFPYFENEDFQAVDLLYNKGNFRMTVFLPRREKNIEEFITELNQEKWDRWTKSFNKMEGKLYLPKFKLEYKLELKDVLTLLGMGIAFQPGNADFSRINPYEPLFISEVIHKTYVDVNEEGTEASAVTVVSMGLGGGGGSNYFSMYVDRPFLFVIRETCSGTIIFMGKIVDPVIE